MGLTRHLVCFCSVPDFPGVGRHLFFSCCSRWRSNPTTRMWPWMHYWLKIPVMYHFATLSLESGIDNDLVNGMLYYPDLKMFAQSARPGFRHLSIYSLSSRYQWVGKPVTDLFRADPATARGRILAAIPWMTDTERPDGRTTLVGYRAAR